MFPPKSLMKPEIRATIPLRSLQWIRRTTDSFRCAIIVGLPFRWSSFLKCSRRAMISVGNGATSYRNIVGAPGAPIIRRMLKKATFSPAPPGTPRRALSQARLQRAIALFGVAGMIPTARVQRGPSEAARCASKGIVPATPSSLFSIRLGDDVTHEIVQSCVGDLDLDEFPCCGGSIVDIDDPIDLGSQSFMASFEQ